MFFHSENRHVLKLRLPLITEFLVSPCISRVDVRINFRESWRNVFICRSASSSVKDSMLCGQVSIYAVGKRSPGQRDSEMTGTTAGRF
jgi:hypothetical protein